MEGFRGRGYLVGAFSLAGTSVVTGRLLTPMLGGFTITAVSLAILLLCLLPFQGAATMRMLRRMSGRARVLLGLRAVFGIFLFRAFLLVGVQHTGAMEAGILTGTTPAVTALLAYAFGKEKPQRVTVAGIALCAAGMICLQGADGAGFRLSTGHLFGNAMILCAVLSESIFTLLSRGLGIPTGADPLPPLAQTVAVSAVALGLSLPLTLSEQPLRALSALGLGEWAALAWYGLGVTALGFVFFFEGVRRCDAYTAAAYSGMMPLCATLLAALWFHEPLGLAQALGCGLVMLGMRLLGGLRPQVECAANR